MVAMRSISGGEPSNRSGAGKPSAREWSAASVPSHGTNRSAHGASCQTGREKICLAGEPWRSAAGLAENCEGGVTANCRNRHPACHDANDTHSLLFVKTDRPGGGERPPAALPLEQPCPHAPEPLLRTRPDQRLGAQKVARAQSRIIRSS